MYINKYLLNGRFRNKRSCLSPESRSSVSEIVVGEIAIDNESDLHWADFPFAERLGGFGFGLLPHLWKWGVAEKVGGKKKEKREEGL